MQQKQVFYKSDFSAILEFDGGWLTPFKLKFWTNSPSRSFIASFDGKTYTNCSVLDDGRLLIAFDSHNMGLGTLYLQPEFYLTAEEFADGICNEVVTPFAPTFVDTDGTEYTLALSLQGDSTLTTIGTLPAYYQKGDKGDQGEQGEQGIQGEAGKDGKDGSDGSILYPSMQVDASGYLVCDMPDAAEGTNLDIDSDGYLCVDFPDVE